MIKRKLRKLLNEDQKKRIRVLKSRLASKYYGDPASKLKLIGVTGTSGKSTTSNMIYHILNNAGYKVGVISTLGAKAGNKIMDTGLHVTTPDPEELQKILSYMVKKGMEYVVIESSSHALAQGRLGNIEFDYAVYTNIKRDHLDWHGSWENYARSKAELILKLKKEGVVVINRGDKETYDFLSNFIKESKREDLKVLTYAITELTGITETKEGIGFIYSEESFFLPIIGRYNVENALATINVCNGIGMKLKEISQGFKTFRTLEGRMQVIQSSPFIVIVDFAHNTDSLQRSLETVKELAGSKNKVIVVFGSAGLRDVEKRFTMGETAVKYADYIIITAEDPRTESLEEINSRIIEGGESVGGRIVKRFKNHEEFKNFNPTSLNLSKGDMFAFDEENVNSRFDAIAFATKIAKPGDIVIAEGKGHEQSMAFGTIEYPFKDQDAVRKALS